MLPWGAAKASTLHESHCRNRLTAEAGGKKLHELIIRLINTLRLIFYPIPIRPSDSRISAKSYCAPARAVLSRISDGSCRRRGCEWTRRSICDFPFEISHVLTTNSISNRNHSADRAVGLWFIRFLVTFISTRNEAFAHIHQPNLFTAPFD